MKKILILLLLLNLTVPLKLLADEDRDLNTYFSKYTKNNDINGYVMISRPNENGYDILYKGEVKSDPNKTFTEDSIFDIGSISKVFTATAIFKCQEDGLLDINDPISLYLDNVPDDKKDITISQLLSHTSGIYVDENPDKTITKEVEINRILSSQLQFTPGENYKYSNAGYTLLAAIIEDVSGMSFEDYITTNIINYDSLTSTGFPDSEYLNEDNAVIGNMDGQSNGKVTDFQFGWYSKGYSDVLSTPSDLTMFINSLISQKILSDDSLKQMASNQVDLDGYYWTNGLEAYDKPNTQYFGHTGVWYGGNSAVFYRQKDNIVITVMTDDVYLNNYYPARALARDFFANYPINSLDNHDIIQSKIFMTPDITQTEQTFANTNIGLSYVRVKKNLQLILVALMIIDLIVIILLGMHKKLKSRKKRKYE